MTLREKIEVMEAFERGEEIEEVRYLGKKWNNVQNPLWDWDNSTYRIKPKPKQVVVIEKWLLKLNNTYCVLEGTDEHHNKHGFEKVKLLDTYELEI